MCATKRLRTERCCHCQRSASRRRRKNVRMYSNTASQLRVPMIELVSQFGDDIVDIVVGGSEAKERSCLRCTKVASMKATTFKSDNPTSDYMNIQRNNANSFGVQIPFARVRPECNHPVTFQLPREGKGASLASHAHLEDVTVSSEANRLTGLQQGQKDQTRSEHF